jgi:hypothetical protein
MYFVCIHRGMKPVEIILRREVGEEEEKWRW